MKNDEFYRKIPIPKKDRYRPVLFSSYWWFYIPSNLLITFLAPLLSKYNRPVSSDEYLRQWGLSAIIVLMLNIVFAWFKYIRPYFNKRRGFYWQGNFTVVGKESSIMSNYLRLKPGNNHMIRVKRELFSAVREGDKIFVERTYLGDTIKIRKVSSGFLERIKRRNESTG